MQKKLHIILVFKMQSYKPYRFKAVFWDLCDPG